MHSLQRLRDIRAFDLFLLDLHTQMRRRKARLKTHVMFNFETGVVSVEERRGKKS